MEPNTDQNFAHIVREMLLCDSFFKSAAMELDLWLVPSLSAGFHQNFTLTEDNLRVHMERILWVTFVRTL